jgi:hypothetical protein
MIPRVPAVPVLRKSRRLNGCMVSISSFWFEVPKLVRIMVLKTKPENFINDKELHLIPFLLMIYLYD